MIKRILFLVGFLTLIMGLSAQSLSPSILSSGGGVTEGIPVSLEWTLGEVSVQSYTASDVWFTEGFHQPVIKVEALGNPPFTESANEAGVCKITIQPNPVSSLLFIRLEGTEEQVVTARLMDVSGKELRADELSVPQTYFQLDMNDLPPAIYFLQFRTMDGTHIRTFKVSKI